MWSCDQVSNAAGSDAVSNGISWGIYIICYINSQLRLCLVHHAQPAHHAKHDCVARLNGVGLPELVVLHRDEEEHQETDQAYNKTE